MTTNEGNHQLMPVDDIELDRSNPSIRNLPEMYGPRPAVDRICLAFESCSDVTGDQSSSTANTASSGLSSFSTTPAPQPKDLPLIPCTY